MIDMVVHRHQLRDRLITLLGLLVGSGPKADVVALAPADEDTQALEMPQAPDVGEATNAGPEE